ncbi:tau-tubulin kinase 1 [Anaeramoeba flamelloides]|uniref:non-specific serine/threonine protein kinase n=1 Tax=Anaeramoeba flamelloides TaxID=1746091 RepID=A0AAV8AHA9_9EUKA|nr:tau-tubulin kinase [Anaeramoeba flamelloides]KAJ6241139.1 tau-tubulin kinase 1 [Anaeramoeba flamelloides]
MEKGFVLRERWKLLNKIGQGGFGEIFRALDLETEEKVAIKLEKVDANKRALRLEVAVLQKMQSSRFSAKFIHCGRTSDYNYVVMELLGRNIAELRKLQPENKFTLATTVRLSQEMISGIEDVHETGYLHRDIKPSNFTLRRHKKSKNKNENQSSHCCIIDFGLARRYRYSNGKIRPPREEVGFRGTARYASINSHDGKELSRRDDLWSLFYLMVEFLRGGLPWQRLKDKDQISEVKKMYTNPDICSDFPEQFTKFYQHLDSLEYEDKPNYDYLRKLLNDICIDRGFDENTKYDWEIYEESQKILKTSLSSFKVITSAPALSGTTNDWSRTGSRKVVKGLHNEFLGDIEKMNDLFLAEFDDLNPENENEKNEKQKERKNEKNKNKKKNSKMSKDEETETNEYDKMMKMMKMAEKSDTTTTTKGWKKKFCCTIL